MPLVILDRDGVINHDSTDYIKSPEEWIPIPGSLEAIARLNHAGYRLIVVTNQSGLGRKLFDIEMLSLIHHEMQRRLAELGGRVEAVFFCPHRPGDACACRKPRPGMLHDIAARLRIELDGIPLIGDKPSDMQAARAVGARAMLVRTGQGRQTLRSIADPGTLEVFPDLAAVADTLIAERR